MAANNNCVVSVDVRNKFPFHWEVRIVKKDGSDHTVILSSNEIRDLAQQISKVSSKNIRDLAQQISNALA